MPHVKRPGADGIESRLLLHAPADFHKENERTPWVLKAEKNRSLRPARALLAL